METQFNTFMHIYFWVYLVAAALMVINSWHKTLAELKAERLKKGGQVNPTAIVGIVLFIMSFKY